MPTQVSSLITQVRDHLVEPTPRFWRDAELVSFMNNGKSDLWRDISDLKQEHFLTIDTENVSLESGKDTLSGVPDNVHKVYNIEPQNTSQTSSNVGLVFSPADWNSVDFQSARGRDPVDPISDNILYAIHRAGGPVGAPQIKVAPTLTSSVRLSFAYVPTLEPLTLDSLNPIPGESDNALIAWTVAYARAKEREDRIPDPGWLQVYASEKAHLLQSLGLREYQDPTYADAVFTSYW